MLCTKSHIYVAEVTESHIRVFQHKTLLTKHGSLDDCCGPRQHGHPAQRLRTEHWARGLNKSVRQSQIIYGWCLSLSGPGDQCGRRQTSNAKSQTSAEVVSREWPTPTRNMLRAATPARQGCTVSTIPCLIELPGSTAQIFTQAHPELYCGASSISFILEIRASWAGGEV